VSYIQAQQKAFGEVKRALDDRQIILFMEINSEILVHADFLDLGYHDMISVIQQLAIFFRKCQEADANETNPTI
jgi:hypothetical protein